MMYPIFRTAVLGLILLAFGLAPSLAQSEVNRTTPNASESPIAHAIEINIAEINLGKEAETKAQNAHVKAFAQMMVKDHTEALAKLRAISGAPTEEIKPSAEHQKAADRLTKLAGSEFDREYIGEMVSGHKAALTFFEQQSKQTTGIITSANPTANDKAFATLAAELVPVVRMHLMEAQQIQTELGRIANPGLDSKSNNAR
jgi:putative membrane protein